MSTRAYIGIQNANGSVRAIYCHQDGYIKNGVGETLFRRYQNAEKINALLDGGDISTLGVGIDEGEGTKFYGRDCGETENIKATSYICRIDFMSGAKRANADYIYFYANGEWLVGNRHSKLQ